MQYNNPRFLNKCIGQVYCRTLSTFRSNPFFYYPLAHCPFWHHTLVSWLKARLNHKLKIDILQRSSVFARWYNPQCAGGMTIDELKHFFALTQCFYSVQSMTSVMKRDWSCIEHIRLHQSCKITARKTCLSFCNCPVLRFQFYEERISEFR